MDSLPSHSGRSHVDSPTTTTKTPPSYAKSISDAGSQSLSSILNNPNVGKSGVYGSDASWVGWWSSSIAVSPLEFAPLIPKSTSELNRSDFQTYLSSISDSYHRFEDIRKHASKESVDVENIGGQGEALVACLREVPALYFKEDFSLSEGATFRAACPFSNVTENIVLQEKLSQYLDVVELHLVKEISLRSNSFFEAQGQLQDLNVKIVEGCSQIRELKETIRLLDTDLVDSARQIQELNATRSNLLALQQKLKLILDVNQALSTLKLLVASGDCAGALDVTDDLQHLLDGDELTGLHCFRHLRDHVAASIDSINSILSAEFMRAAIHDAGDTDVAIISKAKARASISLNGKDDEVTVDDEETSNFRDHLLPLIIGLLRTAKLPSVLRIYRDTLTADMKMAIKTAVAELLPVLVARPLESDFSPGERAVDADGGGSSLASKLRSLSSESFVQLLGAIFTIVRAHLMRAAEVKKAIEWIMCNLDDHYAADSVAAAIAIGAAAAETAQDNHIQSGSLLPYSPLRSGAKIPSFQGKATDATSPSNMSKNFRADVLRENTEAVFAACDAAHGRWAKLLGVRVLLHPRLRLQEFLSIYNITQEFITATEKIGGRLGYSIRGTLQSQAKAFVDFQHESRMTKIKAVLDQETWVEVDVPDEFQAIVTSLVCSEAVVTGSTDDVQGNLMTNDNEVATSNNSTLQAQSGQESAQQQIDRTDSSEILEQNMAQIQPTSSTEGNERNKADASSSSVQSNNNNIERGKSTSQTLIYGGVGYHMVNCGLILLKMLSEYIDMNHFLPALSSEVVHRVVEILKFFNTRTCQLVLGAGAMQVSGLKSITAKHLALASQVISFTYAIIPGRQILFQKVPETRKPLLLSEIDRVAQDYKVHRDEIHTKLIQIMRERLLHHLRQLPQIVETWNRPDDGDAQPSQFARSLTKEVSYLQRILSRTLHEVDVHAIFRQVVIIFHSIISESFSHLDISTPQAKERFEGTVGDVRTNSMPMPFPFSIKLSGLITVKSDVYSFGVVLLEIVRCRSNFEVNVSTADVVLLSTWVYNCFIAKELNKLVGEDEEVDLRTLETMVRVGLLCIQDKPNLRPSMKNVILMLEGTMEIPVVPFPILSNFSSNSQTLDGTKRSITSGCELCRFVSSISRTSFGYQCYQC
ncbi:vacuolar protein sorting-associated protein 54 [Citrus sinensis]|uniref:Vacuolar protein sorting-associated protein 54 n=1 Tax=Citrus sinensis TaxID=2711 RepID=A0ACB8NEB2_CITSI|nr:vacuolar protein sorting-associated protein 54 [Citrus sinensis]